MSIAGNIIGGLFGIGQSGIDYATAQQNLQFQKENLEYQKQLQKQIFGREDTAVQRRAQDLQAAGLSKTLAAGSGAGAGQVVGTSAPQMSNVDILNRALSVAQGLADMKRTQAEAENALKRNEQIDSQIINDQVNRDYTRVKMALEQGNLDMLPLTRKQKEESINLTKKQLSYIDEQISASMQNRKVSEYNLRFVLPKEVMYKTQQIVNLKKQGAVHDADVLLKDLQGDLLVHNINNALFQSKISELDYYYQQRTGFKPRSATPMLGDVAGTLNSKGYTDYLHWLDEMVKKTVSNIQGVFGIGKDKTPE